MQDIIGKVLHRLIDLDPAVLKRIELTMESVLSDYEIQEKGTELMPINAGWQTELQTFLDRKRICGKSEKTLEQYQYNLSRALGYINKPVKDITTADLADYLEKYKRVRKVSNVYLQNIRLNLSSFFTWLHDKGMIPPIMDRAYLEFYDMDTYGTFMWAGAIGPGPNYPSRGAEDMQVSSPDALVINGKTGVDITVDGRGVLSAEPYAAWSTLFKVDADYTQIYSTATTVYGDFYLNGNNTFYVSDGDVLVDGMSVKEALYWVYARMDGGLFDDDDDNSGELIG